MKGASVFLLSMCIGLTSCASTPEAKTDLQVCEEYQAELRKINFDMESWF